MLDEALPGNNIPRVFINTGIEYAEITKFVLEMAQKDKRIVTVLPKTNIQKTLQDVGYPFKSKDHSNRVAQYQISGMEGKTVRKYLGMEEGSNLYHCPKCLQHQFTPEYDLKISDKCCKKLKKEPARRWEKENNRNIRITGIRMKEGGNRSNHPACVSFNKGKLTSFKPLNPCSDDFMTWYINSRNIKLCDLYYPPYNFKRTGCKGCPFNIQLQQQLDVMEKLLPFEKIQCEIIWKPVYDEYRKLGYRLRKESKE